MAIINKNRGTEEETAGGGAIKQQQEAAPTMIDWNEAGTCTSRTSFTSSSTATANSAAAQDCPHLSFSSFASFRFHRMNQIRNRETEAATASTISSSSSSHHSYSPTASARTSSASGTATGLEGLANVPFHQRDDYRHHHNQIQQEQEQQEDYSDSTLEGNGTSTIGGAATEMELSIEENYSLCEEPLEHNGMMSDDGNGTLSGQVSHGGHTSLGGNGSDYHSTGGSSYGFRKKPVSVISLSSSRHRNRSGDKNGRSNGANRNSSGYLWNHQTEERAVFYTKLTFLTCLALTTIVMSIVVYTLVRKEETDDFKTQVSQLLQKPKLRNAFFFFRFLNRIYPPCPNPLLICSSLTRQVKSYPFAIANLERFLVH